MFDNMFWNWIEYNRESNGDGFTLLYYRNKKTGKKKVKILAW